MPTRTYADVSTEGARCKECITLAGLHSTAVDFVKSGIAAVFPKELRTNSSPSFMQNTRKQSYESTKVLGMIYNKCILSKNHRYTLPPVKVDPSLLLHVCKDYLEIAYEYYQDYNDQFWQIMNQYGVYDEMELLSGNVSHFTRRAVLNGGRGGLDSQMRLNKAIKLLRLQYRNLFWEEVKQMAPTGSDNITTTPVNISTTSNISAMNVAAIYLNTKFPPGMDEGTAKLKSSEINHPQGNVSTTSHLPLEFRYKAWRLASAWYHCAYHTASTQYYQQQQQQQQSESSHSPLFISFPWVVHDVISEIKSMQQVSFGK